MLLLFSGNTGGAVTYNMTLSASLSMSATARRDIAKIASCAQSANASINKSVMLVKTASANMVPTIFKIVGLVKSIAQACSATVTASFLYLMTLSASVSLASVLTTLKTVGGNVVDWIIQARRRGTR